MAIKNEDDVIVISEDDHEFTSAYSKELFIKNIMEAHAQGADYLSGGTGGFSFAIPITPNRYWLNPCFSTQFIIIFKKFFDRILAEPFDEEVIADILLPSMTSHKMVMYPFISNQKDFGYSDASPVHENDKGMIRRIFIRSSRTMEKLQQAYMKYNLSTAEY
jgi:glycosyl transferase family 25